MPPTLNTTDQDLMLAAMTGDITHMYLSATQDTVYATANANKLCRQALVGGDFAAAAGSPSGRKTTRAAKTGVPVTASGTAAYVVYVNETNSRVVATIPLSASVPITNGGTVDIGSHSWTLTDPT